MKKKNIEPPISQITQINNFVYFVVKSLKKIYMWNGKYWENNISEKFVNVSNNVIL